jgi:2-furoyl-CoA dehydrogenase large subunit
MAIMLGGAAKKAAEIVRDRAIRVAAHNLGRSPDAVIYTDGTVSASDDPSKSLTWDQIVRICHRQNHLMPPDMEPGLQASYTLQVPKGGAMPTEDGRVQMYPCFSFEAHMALVEIDPGTGKVEIPEYYVAHDCGTVINPLIVKGMMLGGIAHGIGAALYEKFEYDESGQHLSGTFMDYLLPSSLEIPMVGIAEHCTPSPLTSHGQKGAGEAGYPGSPAVIAGAVNDALAPLGRRIDTLPIRLGQLGALFGELAARS